MDIQQALEVSHMKPSDVLFGQALEVLRDHYLEVKSINENLTQISDVINTEILKLSVSYSNLQKSYDALQKSSAAGEWLDYPLNKPEESKLYLTEEIVDRGLILHRTETYYSLTSDWSDVKRFAEVRA